MNGINSLILGEKRHFSALEMIKSKTEMIKSKTEMVKSKTEMIKSKTEMIKSKTEMIKSKIEMVKSITKKVNSKAKKVKKSTENKLFVFKMATNHRKSTFYEDKYYGTESVHRTVSKLKENNVRK